MPLRSTDAARGQSPAFASATAYATRRVAEIRRELRARSRSCCCAVSRSPRVERLLAALVVARAPARTLVELQQREPRRRVIAASPRACRFGRAGLPCAGAAGCCLRGGGCACGCGGGASRRASPVRAAAHARAPRAGGGALPAVAARAPAARGAAAASSRRRARRRAARGSVRARGAAVQSAGARRAAAASTPPTRTLTCSPSTTNIASSG